MPLDSRALTSIRARAMAVDYKIERSVLKDRVYLIRPDGEREINPARNNPNWTVAEAKRFLEKLTQKQRED